jgi:hypothetical protein
MSTQVHGHLRWNSYHNARKMGMVLVLVTRECLVQTDDPA